jgi:hypothetical protein
MLGYVRLGWVEWGRVGSGKSRNLFFKLKLAFNNEIRYSKQSFEKYILLVKHWKLSIVPKKWSKKYPIC